MSTSTIEPMEYMKSPVRKEESNMLALSSIIGDDIDMLDCFDADEAISVLMPEDIEESVLLHLESIDDDADTDTKALTDEGYFSGGESSTSSLATTSPFASVSSPYSAQPISQNELNVQYDELEQKLATCMRKSAMSRTQLFDRQISTSPQKQSYASATPSTNNQSLKPQSVVGAAGFLNGSRKTLTAALEQSREQLDLYMAQLDHF